MRSPRERMVVSAALLIRERGAHADRDLGRPRAQRRAARVGLSLLPGRADPAALRGGRLRRRARRPRSSAEAAGSLELLDTLLDKYRRQLLESDFRAGCPVVAVAVEAGEEPTGAQAPVIERAAAVFARWTDLIAAAASSPTASPPDRADELAMLATAALEGAIVLARVRRDLTAARRRPPPTAQSARGRERRTQRREPHDDRVTGSPPRASSASATAASSCRSRAARWRRSAATRTIRPRRATPATRRCGSTTTRTTAPG